MRFFSREYEVARAPRETKNGMLEELEELASAEAVLENELLVLGLSIVLMVVGAVFFMMLAKRRDWLMEVGAQTFILVLTITSFFAVGAGKQLNLSRLAGILVLFLLSELVLVLFVRTRVLDGRLADMGERVTKEISNASDSFRRDADGVIRVLQGIERDVKAADLSSAAADIRDAAKISVASVPFARRLAEYDPEFAATVARKFGEVGDAWYEAVREAFEERDLVSTSLWRVIAESYFDQEVDDVSKKMSRWKSPQIITNETFYLSLVRSLTEEVNRHDQAREPVFLGISVMLPEYWYNWPRNPGEHGSFVLEGMAQLRDGFDSEIMPRLREAGVDYSRLVLLGGDEQVEQDLGFRNGPFDRERGDGEDHSLLVEEQQDLFLVSRRRVGPTAAVTHRPLEIAEHEHIQKVLGLRCRAEPRKEESAFFIVDGNKNREIKGLFENADELKGGNEKRAYLKILEMGGDEFYISKLVDAYMYELHSDPDLARYVGVSNAEAQDYEKITLGRRDFDQWLVGFRAGSGERVEWKAVMSTTMRPGYGTMLLNVVTDPERATEVGEFWTWVMKEKAEKWNPKA